MAGSTSMKRKSWSTVSSVMIQAKVTCITGMHIFPAPVRVILWLTYASQTSRRSESLLVVPHRLPYVANILAWSNLAAPSGADEPVPHSHPQRRWLRHLHNKLALNPSILLFHPQPAILVFLVRENQRKIPTLHSVPILRPAMFVSAGAFAASKKSLDHVDSKCADLCGTVCASGHCGHYFPKCGYCQNKDCG